MLREALPNCLSKLTGKENLFIEWIHGNTIDTFFKNCEIVNCVILMVVIDKVGLINTGRVASSSCVAQETFLDYF